MPSKLFGSGWSFQVRAITLRLLLLLLLLLLSFRRCRGCHFPQAHAPRLFLGLDLRLSGRGRFGFLPLLLFGHASHLLLVPALLLLDLALQPPLLQAQLSGLLVLLPHAGHRRPIALLQHAPCGTHGHRGCRDEGGKQGLLALRAQSVPRRMACQAASTAAAGAGGGLLAV